MGGIPPRRLHGELFFYPVHMARWAPNNPPTLFERDFGRVVVRAERVPSGGQGTVSTRLVGGWELRCSACPLLRSAPPLGRDVWALAIVRRPRPGY